MNAPLTTITIPALGAQLEGGSMTWSCLIASDRANPHGLETLKAQAAPLSDAEFAIDMLKMMFTAYENGVPCYEDPEDEVGFVGYAVRLADDDFKNIGDFLNRVRPVQPGIKEQG